MFKKIMFVSGLLALSTLAFNTSAKEVQNKNEDTYYSFNVKNNLDQSNLKVVDKMNSVIHAASGLQQNSAKDLKCHLEKSDNFFTSTLDVKHDVPGRTESFTIYPIEIKDNVMKMVVTVDYSKTSNGEVIKVNDACNIQDNTTISYNTQKLIEVELGKAHTINLAEDVSFDIKVEKYDKNKF